MSGPNVIFVFADQFRAQAAGFAGDPNVRTPHLDRLARQSLCFENAVSGCPVCSPARASLMTGQYPDRHGVFVNDVCLSLDVPSLAEVFAGAGYATANIGKWHINGHGRSAYIPPDHRRGFQRFLGLECTHTYNESLYYADDDPGQRIWDGYDAIAQTRAALGYIHDRAQTADPFLLVLSWGPPHAPYETAPAAHRSLYRPESLVLRGNVPGEIEPEARAKLAGYYAHITALDDCLGRLLAGVRAAGIEEETIFVFWSDHGDMLGSQGEWTKQRPWDESIMVPLLLRYPARFGAYGRRIAAPINTPDLMPTLLGLCDITPPQTVQGSDYTQFLCGQAAPPADAALIACYHPFGQWTREQGGREYRGVRTRRYTYVRTLDGPWLLYDNECDPFQRRNRIDDAEYAAVRESLESSLQGLLARYGDEFLTGDEYVTRWGYRTDSSGTIPFRW